MERQFDDSSVKKIVNQAMIYQCACPAQVAELLLELRRVEAYEQECLEQENDELASTHVTISKAVREAHQVLEKGLDDVLDLEGWDRRSFDMPEHLRSLR